MIDCAVHFVVNSRAIPAIRELIGSSTHPDPILAIVWRGTGPDQNIAWRWDLMTHDKRALELIEYLCFEASEFTFFATHEDLKFLESELNKLQVDVVDGCLKVLPQRSA